MTALGGQIRRYVDLQGQTIVRRRDNKQIEHYVVHLSLSICVQTL